MFPDSDHFPAELSKSNIGVLISCPIGLELRPPEFSVRFGQDRMFWTQMPETTVDENSDSSLREGDINAAPAIERSMPMNSVPESSTMEFRTKLPLGSGVDTGPL